MNLLETLRSLWQRASQAWRVLPPHQRMIAGGLGALAIVLVGYLSFGGTRGCASREDVEARVALVSSQLQEAATQGKLSVDELAKGIKSLNEGATAYNASHDHQAYCSALKELSGDFLDQK